MPIRIVMDENDFDWLKNSKAFALFKDELKERLQLLENLQKSVTETHSARDYSQQLTLAKQGFHKTKGAAGMFGLAELATAAANLEHYFGANLRGVFSINLESKALIEQFQRCATEVLEVDE